MTPPPLTTSQQILDIAPGQYVFASARGGTLLQGLEGRIDVRLSPVICGEVLHSGGHTLTAGQTLAQDTGTPATWIYLGNTGRHPARVLCTETVSARSPAGKAWDWLLQMATARNKRHKVTQDPNHALPAAQ